MEDDSHVVECLRMIEAGRAFLTEEFTAMKLKCAPSRANFMLVDVGRSASEVFHWLLKEGVIVRPMTSFGMESALRVTIGTPEENRRFVKALKKVLAGAKSA
jgi:histidinol-phosphate aminotransferase